MLDCISFSYDGVCQGKFWASYGLTMATAGAVSANPLAGAVTGLVGSISMDELIRRR